MIEAILPPMLWPTSIHLAAPRVRLRRMTNSTVSATEGPCSHGVSPNPGRSMATTSISRATASRRCENSTELVPRARGQNATGREDSVSSVFDISSFGEMSVPSRGLSKRRQGISTEAVKQRLDSEGPTVHTMEA